MLVSNSFCAALLGATGAVSRITVKLQGRMRSGVSTSIRLPSEMVAKLRKIARKKGDIGYQTLIKIWKAERLFRRKQLCPHCGAKMFVQHFNNAASINECDQCGWTKGFL